VAGKLKMDQSGSGITGRVYIH